jgi:hypothetical protein
VWNVCRGLFVFLHSHQHIVRLSNHSRSIWKWLRKKQNQNAISWFNLNNFRFLIQFPSATKNVNSHKINKQFPSLNNLSLPSVCGQNHFQITQFIYVERLQIQ